VESSIFPATITMIKVSFKPKQVTKKLLGVLSERARDVLTKRYGLGTESDTQTLESIGQTYGITRERVRQIENYGITTIQKSSAYKELAPLFEELRGVIEEMGGIITEKQLLESLAKDESTQNHFFFILIIGAPFLKHKEDEHFVHRWSISKEHAGSVESALKRLHKTLGDEDLVAEDVLLIRLHDALRAEAIQKVAEETLLRWLALSRVLGKNPLGEWGVATSSNVRAKGIRDFAYLAVKRHGSPMHFREVAESIKELFDRKAHVATCHNELIKDRRFVLVGRGLYALSEWGYSAGVVKDVLQEIIKKYGPLTRDEIIDKVRKERYVKDNTIIVNLQDDNIFKKLPDGAYALAD
jgi:hypothetical protein